MVGIESVDGRYRVGRLSASSWFMHPSTDAASGRHNVRAKLLARVCRVAAERPREMQTRDNLLQRVVVPPSGMSPRAMHGGAWRGGRTASNWLQPYPALAVRE